MCAGTTTHAPVVAAPPPDASPLLTLLDSPWSLPLVLLGAAVVAYQLLLRAPPGHGAAARGCCGWPRPAATRPGAVSVLRGRPGCDAAPASARRRSTRWPRWPPSGATSSRPSTSSTETDATLGPRRAVSPTARPTTSASTSAWPAPRPSSRRPPRRGRGPAHAPPGRARPLAYAWGTALSIRLAAARRDHATTLRLLREHAVANEWRLTLRERWLLRAARAPRAPRPRPR